MAIRNRYEIISKAAAGVPFWGAYGSSIFFVDHKLKAWVIKNLSLYSTHIVGDQNWIAVTRIPNPGLIGLRFSNYPPGFIEPYILYYPSAIWLVLASITLIRYRSSGLIDKLGYFSVLAGGGSNLWDHWHSRFVTDSLLIWMGPGSWRPCNLADVFLCAGGLTLVFSNSLGFFSKDEPRIQRESRPYGVSNSLSTQDLRG